MARQYMVIVGAFSLLLLIVGCDVDVKNEGKLPDVDVETSGGQLPEYKQTQEAQLPDVDVDARGGELPDIDVRGPDVDVSTDTVEVPVPDIDISLPDEHEPVSRK